MDNNLKKFLISKVNMEDVELSKRKIKEGIKSGKYSGWDDEKLITLAVLKKKYKPEAIWRFTEKMGFIEADRTLDRKEFFRLLDSYNK